MRGGVTDAGQTNSDDEQLKIGLLSQWKLKAEFRNLTPKKYAKPGFPIPKNIKNTQILDSLTPG